MAKITLMGSHVSGISLFGEDEIINANVENGNIVFKSALSKNKSVSLNIDKITSARILTEKEIIEKNKSVVGRAVVGTFIAGPIGSIVGGMSGVGNKKKNKSYRTLIINYDDGKQVLISEDKWATNFDKFTKELNKLIINENQFVL